MEIDELWRRYKTAPTEELHNALVEHYLPLVKVIAQKLRNTLPRSVELDDLISAGVFGLMDAMRGFDLSRGAQFHTYAPRRIRGAMLDELREMDWVPRLVRVRASQLAKATEGLQRELGRQPTCKELARRMGLSVAKLQELIAETRQVELGSLSRPFYETDSHRTVVLLDILENAAAERPETRTADLDFLRETVRGLDKAERLIVILYYYEGLTMKEIGATLDRSESRVSQMHTAIMERLRSRLAARGCGHQGNRAVALPMAVAARSLFSEKRT